MSETTQMRQVRGRAGLTRKTIVQVLMGTVVSAFAMFAALSVAEETGREFAHGDQLAAVAISAVYVLMGLLVLVGAGMPKVGASLLNVEDETEVRQDRRTMLASALPMVLIGTTLFAVAMVAKDGSSGLDRRVAAGLAMLSLLVTLVVSVRLSWAQDELNKRVSTEAAALTAYLLALVFGGWAIAAQLGYAAMFTPLGFVAGCLALLLLSIFVAAGRRGMLNLGRR